MKNKRKTIIILVCFIFVLATVGIWIYPFVYEYQCKTRKYNQMEELITNDILKSNIVIVNFEEKTNDNVTSMTYGTGASGVIFDSVGDTYYALTAYHIVRGFKNAEYYILPYGAPTYAEYSKNCESYVSNEMYYGQFEKATVVLLDEEYDLAIISFKSKETLNSLLINQTNPRYKEKIAVISNPKGERFVYSFGTIKSKKYFEFKSNDGLLSTNIYKHNAYVNSGSSGSVVLNQNMRIVGINIGGGTDIFGRYKYGCMIPCELIHRCLEKNGFEK